MDESSSVQETDIEGEAGDAMFEVVKGEDTWRVTHSSAQICAVKGSTVEIPCTCTYTYPSTIRQQTTVVQSRFWFTKDRYEPVDVRTDPDYSGRVEYLFHENVCTLRIKNLRERDSAVYKFMFTTNQPGGSLTGDEGVTLSITDLQVQVETKRNQAELKCYSSCNVADNPSYVWYRNGKNMTAEKSSIRVSVHENNKYSCSVKGREDYRSPEVYAPKLPSVSVSPSAEIVKCSSVTVTCSSDANPAPEYTWYNMDGRELSKESELVFSSVQSSDSGRYYCKAKNDLGERTSGYVKVEVKYAPKLPSVSVSPSAEIVENSTVTLTCSSDANPAANYTWYKKNGNPDFQPLSKGPELVFSSVQSSDSGEFYCAAENDLGRRTSEHFISDVKYAPKLPSLSVSPSAEIVEGSSVTLTCSSDANPAATFKWYKRNQTPQYLHEGAQLVFNYIQPSASGEYYCGSENKLGRKRSGYVSINVKYAPSVCSASVSPAGEIRENSRVTVTCSCDANPAPEYIWYNVNGRELSKESELVFSSVQSSDSGEFSCKAENDLGKPTYKWISIDVKYAPKLPSVSVSPSAEIVEGSSVTLTCSSDANPAAKYTWFKEDEDSPTASGQIFTISTFSADHSGRYYCEAQNTRGRHNSTLHLLVVAGNSTFIIHIIKWTLLLLMLISLFLLTLWTR
ncbi:B-cell receptor CD22-like [Labrus bergylta]|uniref:B-cell receptor CD22-like n=1 Tax=Labrus bergylta TaxID=56723 RepID=UPI003313874A